MDFLIEPFFYNWLIVGALLLIVEVASFTLLFLWLAIAAVIMAGISFIFPDMTITTQLWIFSLLAVTSVIVWQQVFKKTQERLGDHKMNNRAARYIGRTATLSEAIINGHGKIQIEDSFWRVECDSDLAAGERVEVIDAVDVILKVKPK